MSIKSPLSRQFGSRFDSVFDVVKSNPVYDKVSRIPTLDLDFAKSKSLYDGRSTNNLITFTRNSTGTYVGSDGLIKTAAVNEARFDHNPTTGESLGLLVEEQRANNLVYSQDFSNTWTTSNVDVLSNTAMAPDGTTTADAILPPSDGLTTTRLIRQNPLLTAQQAYTFSVFAKLGTATTNGIALYVSDSTASNSFRGSFNLASASSTVGSTGWVTPTAEIVPYPNGWYRCILTGVTSTEHTSLRAIIYLRAFGTTADDYGSVYLWGAQLEAGSFPTSYIPTEGVAVTRGADFVSITGTNFSSWYRQDEGTVFAEFRDSPSTQSEYPFAISDNTVSNRFTFFTSGSSSLNSRLISAGSVFNPSNVSFIASSLIRACTAGKTGADQAITACNGVLSNDGSPTSMPAVDRMYIGGAHNGLEQTNGTIRRLTYWPARLPNEKLKSVTA